MLSLNRTALSRDDVVTSQIETLLYAFGGAFEVKPAEGLKVTELVKSSPNSMLVDNVIATMSGDEATKGFKPYGKAHAARAAPHRQVQDRVPGRQPKRTTRQGAGRRSTPALRRNRPPRTR